DDHRIIIVPNISGGAPHLAANHRSPFPDILNAVLAKAVENRPARGGQVVVHFFVNGSHLLGLVNLITAAPVVFDEINSPMRERLRILLFMAITGFAPATGGWAGARVNSHF